MPLWFVGYLIAQVTTPDQGVLAELMDEIMGPRGLLAGAIVAVIVLWRLREKERAAHLSALDARIVALEKERDIALEGWREQTSASARQATAMEEDARDRNARGRASDRR